MSIAGIIFLALSIVLLGMGFFGANVDIASATGAALSIAQMKNFYLLLGGVILFIVLYRLLFTHVSLRVQHVMSTTIRYVILIAVGVFMVYPLLWMISATFKDLKEFQRITRRCGVDYAIRKVGGDKPRVLVFFKARDSDALTAALKELASTKARTQSERPSVLQRLEKAKEQAAKTIGKIRNREPSR